MQFRWGDDQLLERLAIEQDHLGRHQAHGDRFLDSIQLGASIILLAGIEILHKIRNVNMQVCPQSKQSLPLISSAPGLLIEHTNARCFLSDFI